MSANKSAGIRHPALVVALVVLALAIGSVGLFVVYTKFIARGSGSARSEDQKLLQGFYGDPPFFVVEMIKDESQRQPRLVRREVWIYPAKKAAIVFLNGKYELSKDIEPLKPNLTKSVALSPDQINDALSVDQLSSVIGSKPQTSVGMPGQLMRDTTWYEYGNGVSALFVEGRLQLVQTVPTQQGK